MRIAAFILAALAALAAFGPAARASDLPVTDQVLPNGVRLIIQQEPDTPLVAVNVFVKTAGAPEDASHPGLANMVARTLLTGTTNQNQETISREINVLGGNVAAIWDRNFTQIRAVSLGSQFDDTAYLISDILKNATFDDNAVAQAKKDLLQQFDNQSDNVYRQTYNQLKEALYKNVPISPTDLGDPGSVAAIRPSDVRSFFAKYYTADNIVVSIVGNVSPDHVVRVFGGDLADFSRRTARRNVSLITDTPKPPAAPGIVKAYRGDLNSGYVMVGYLVPGAGSEDYPEMLILNALLGGMKTSLLFTNLREKQGLGYETSSSYSEDVGTADLTGYILSPGDKSAPPAASPKVQTTADDSGSPPAPDNGSAPSNPSFGGVKSALIDQFSILRAQPPTPQMLDRAKKFVIGSYLIRHERLADRAYYLGFSELALASVGGYRFDTHFADVIEKVSSADIQRVARQYLSGGYVVSLVLPGDPNAGQVSR